MTLSAQTLDLRRPPSTPWVQMLLGLACGLPFLLFNALVATGHGPTRQFFRGVISGQMWQTNPLGSAVFFLSLGLIGAGAVVLLRLAATCRPRAARWLALVLGLVMLTGFVALSGAFAQEAYQCQILGTPNCD